MASRLDSSGRTEYSGSFELEEALSSSGSMSELASRMKTLELSSPAEGASAGASCSSSLPPSGRRRPLGKATGSKLGPSLSFSVSKTDGTTSVVAQDSEEGSRFKAAVRKVQTIQSVTKHFKDSLEVRDAAYSEWLTRKQASIAQERGRKVAAKSEEENRKREKEVEKEERVKNAVERWNREKEVALREKQKAKEEEERKAKELEEGRSSKQRESAEASERWREEKRRKLLETERKKRRVEEQENAKREEEAAERVQSAESAFKAWSQRKTELIRQQHQKEKREREAKQAMKSEARLQQQEKSKEVVVTWTKTKEDSIRRNKGLYTYNRPRAVNSGAWCPARSVKYRYPSTAAGNETAQQRAAMGSRQSLYSSSTGSVCSVGRDSISVGTSPVGSGHSEAASPEVQRRGTLKTIQLCCQTLEYWCTCDNC